jgi:hypothetical protein
MLGLLSKSLGMRCAAQFRMTCSINIYPEVIPMHLMLVEDDLELGAELQRALASPGLRSEWGATKAPKIQPTVQKTGRPENVDFTR